MSNNVLPSGMIMPFAGNSTPEGFLICDGSLVSRTTYAALYAAIGNIHGQGDGSTTFHLPDYRGRFLRGRDSGAGRDPDAAGRTASNTGGATGDNVGSVQADATAKNGLAASQSSHNHIQYKANTGATGGSSYPSQDYVGGNSPGGSNVTGSTTPAITVTGDNETRPVNAYVSYVIKI